LCEKNMNLLTDNLPLKRKYKEFFMKKRNVSLGILSFLLVFGLLVVGCDDGNDTKTEGTYTVTFNADGGSAVSPITGVAAGATITLPAAPTKAGFDFGGWFTEANGGGTEFTAATAVNASITVYAKWTAEVNLPETPEPSFIEKIYAENGAFALYKFTLPAGATFGDYSSITATYKADETNFALSVRARALGNYASTLLVPNAAGAVELNLNNYNAPYIISQVGANDVALDVVSPGATADNWFTVTYLLDGTQKNSGYSDGNKPADGATGDFYYFVGLTRGGGDNSIEYYAGDVTLVHSSDPTKNVVSHGSGFGATGFIKYADRPATPYATRQLTKGAYDVPSVAGLSFAEKLTVENGAFVLYKFTLPAGATFGDYSSITAKYWADETNFAYNVRARAMGNYADTLFVPDVGGAVTLDLNNYNAPYIISQVGANDVALDVVSPGATAGNWFPVTYLLDESQKNSGYSAANKPANSATGDFYYFVGLTRGGGNNVIEYYAGDVTLVHKTDAAKNVVSSGSGFGATGFIQYGDRPATPYATRGIRKGAY
jgi:uncharacterized repeat protein (TIGR02543 family)